MNHDHFICPRSGDECFDDRCSFGCMIVLDEKIQRNEDAHADNEIDPDMGAH